MALHLSNIGISNAGLYKLAEFLKPAWHAGGNLPLPDLRKIDISLNHSAGDESMIHLLDLLLSTRQRRSPPSPLSLPLSLPLVIALHRSHLSLNQLGGTGLLSPALPAATQPSVRPTSVGRVDIAIATATASAAISAAASATSAAPFASVSCACLHIMCVYITMAICQCTGDSGQRGVRKRSA